MQPILIRGGRVIDPARGFDQTADVLLADGAVARIATDKNKIGADEAAQIVDAEGCIVCPGLIDIHVHLREPSGGTHEETIATGMSSAINGGFTSVCCMPNTNPPLDSPESMHLILDRAARARLARLLPSACATAGRAGTEIAQLAELAGAGAMAFTDDGSVVPDEKVMEQVLTLSRDLDRPFMQHCQEPSMTEGASMNAGPVAERLGQVGWPVEAEEVIIERDIRINRDIGCRYDAQHVSSGGSVGIIRKARQDGQPVVGELTPHHLLLTDVSCEQQGPDAKMNPPLRTRGDIDQLKKGVADGTMTILATDHAPHPRKTKDVPFASAAFGIVGMDCALPLYAMALIEDGVIDWPGMLAMLTINPATLLGVDRLGLGSLVVGGPADVTVIDPDLPWVIDAGEFATTGRNCPFDGWDVKGRAVAVIVAGEMKLMRDPQRAS